MKVKRILRFYFAADSLEMAFGNIILRTVRFSAESRGEVCAERLCRIIGEKSELSLLWNYLDGVITALSGEEILSLKNYAQMRTGLDGRSVAERRGIKRAVVKFARRARRINKFGEALDLIGKYYCLINTF